MNEIIKQLESISSKYAILQLELLDLRCKIKKISKKNRKKTKTN